MPSPSPFDPMQPTSQPIDIPAIFARTGDSKLNELLALIQPDAPLTLLGKLIEPFDAMRFKSQRWHRRFPRSTDDTSILKLCSFDVRGHLGVSPIRNLGGVEVDLRIVNGSVGNYIVVYDARKPVAAPHTTVIVNNKQMVAISLCLGEPIVPSEVKIEDVQIAGYDLDKLITVRDAENLGFDFAKIEMKQP